MSLLRHSLLNPRLVWKLALFYIGSSLSIAFLLGLVFQIIFAALTIVIALLVPIFDPAYRLLLLVLRPDGVPTHLAPSPIWLRLFLSVLLIFPLIMTIAGIWILFHTGFCDQNIGCTLLLLQQK